MPTLKKLLDNGAIAVGYDAKTDLAVAMAQRHGNGYGLSTIEQYKTFAFDIDADVLQDEWWEICKQANVGRTAIVER